MIDRYGLPSLAALIVCLMVVATFVNMYAPTAKRRLRRSLILVGLHAFALAIAVFVVERESPWAPRAVLIATLFKAFAFTQLLAVFFFDVILRKLKVELVSIISDITVAAGYIGATFWVLASAKVDATSVLTGSAIVSAVLALSLQATLGNILGGVALQLDGSVHVGDWIQLEDGKQARVRQIRWRHTVLETRDWSTIIVPNSMLLAQSIILLGHRDGKAGPQRMWVYFNVDFRHTPAKVVEVVQGALLLAPIENVANDPAPNVICMDLAKDGRDSFAVYAVRYWLIDLAADDPTSSRVRARIFTALKRANISLARPAQTFFFNADDRGKTDERDAKYVDERLALIRNVDIFAPLTEEERRSLATHMHYAPFAPGEIMTRQGAVAHYLYVIASGKAEVRLKTDNGESRLVATLESPTFFGEMGMMMGEPRRADVVAVTDVECLRLDKEGFEAVIMNRPELAHAMSSTLAQRQVELDAATEGLNAEAMRARVSMEQERMLGRIQTFFGLGMSQRPPRA